MTNLEKKISSLKTQLERTYRDHGVDLATIDEAVWSTHHIWARSKMDIEGRWDTFVNAVHEEIEWMMD